MKLSTKWFFNLPFIDWYSYNTYDISKEAKINVGYRKLNKYYHTYNALINSDIYETCMVQGKIWKCWKIVLC